MTEQELRSLVREAIARQLGQRDRDRPADARAVSAGLHASHGKFELPVLGSECLIEPSVTCNHCGYCKSYGH